MYIITLADGKKITNLEKNASNYISKTKVDESIFENNLTTMIVSDGVNEELFSNMVFVQQMEWNDGTFYLTFREKTEEEKKEDVITEIQMALAEVYEMAIGGAQNG